MEKIYEVGCYEYAMWAWGLEVIDSIPQEPLIYSQIFARYLHEIYYSWLKNYGELNGKVHITRLIVKNWVALLSILTF